MADDGFPSASSQAAHASGRHTQTAPPGHGLRRVATLDHPASLRRRHPAATPGLTDPSAAAPGLSGIRRRSSNFSDYSLTDARRDLETSADELLNPRGGRGDRLDPGGATSPTSYVPLVLALLPALAGTFFKNGASFLTDLILLSLAAVILHWSVTQPWDWYLSAQHIHVIQDDDDDLSGDDVFDSDSTESPLSAVPSVATALEEVPEEDASAEGSARELNQSKGRQDRPGDEEEEDDDEGKQREDGSQRKEPGLSPSQPRVDHPRASRTKRLEAKRAAAVKELRFHEITALLWCFIFPVLSAYILHMIRGQLSRPSEGLISDYNLTIFLCAAEFRPVSHLIRMVRSRTLRIQKFVAKNPHETSSAYREQLHELSSRLRELEVRSTTSTTLGGMSTPPPPQHEEHDASEMRPSQAEMAREIHATMQPELDALNRAMRRYEKKLALLASQTDNRLEYIDYRLQDAIALAAVAAKNSNSRVGITSWLVDKTVTAAVFPFQAAMAVLTFPFRTVSTLLQRSSTSKRPMERPHRPATRNGSPAQVRANPDRVPARMSRR